MSRDLIKHRNFPLGRSSWNSPFQMMRDFERDMSRGMNRQMSSLFNDFFPDNFFNDQFNDQEDDQEFYLRKQKFWPACDVEEKNDHFLLHIDLPGIKKEDIKVELSDHNLMISGERKIERKRSRDDHLEVYSERNYGSFYRSFTLPQNVDANQIEADFDNGVLSLYLPKTSVTPTKKIEVTGKKEGGFFSRLLGKENTAHPSSSTINIENNNPEKNLEGNTKRQQNLKEKNMTSPTQ